MMLNFQRISCLVDRQLASESPAPRSEAYNIQQFLQEPGIDANWQFSSMQEHVARNWPEVL
jgi:hypothetical protein